MANKRIIELNERTEINMGDYLMVDDATGSRKLAMSTLFNYLTYSSLMFVDTLPTTDIDPTVIYLVPHSGSTTQWDEYIYRDNQWILIGTSTLDLTSIYQTKTDNNLQTNSKQIVGAINEVNSKVPDTVVVENTNNYTIKRYGKVVEVAINGTTASLIHGHSLGDIAPTHTTFNLVVIHYNNLKYMGILSAGSSGLFLTYCPTYGSDNITVPSGASVYGTLSYILD